MVATKTVGFLDVTPRTNESHLRVIKVEVLMCKLVYPTHKKFLGLVLTLLPRTLAHCHQNVQPLGAVINDPNT